MIDWRSIEHFAYRAGVNSNSDKASKNQAMAIAKMITAALKEYDYYKDLDTSRDQTN